MVLTTRNGMMRHKKLQHIEDVRECYKFQTDDCGFSDKFCWNKHTSINHENTEHEEQDQGFHRRPANAAPPEKGSTGQICAENLAEKN